MKRRYSKGGRLRGRRKEKPGEWGRNERMEDGEGRREGRWCKRKES